MRTASLAYYKILDENNKEHIINLMSSLGYSGSYEKNNNELNSTHHYHWKFKKLADHQIIQFEIYTIRIYGTLQVKCGQLAFNIRNFISFNNEVFIIKYKVFIIEYIMQGIKYKLGQTMFVIITKSQDKNLLSSEHMLAINKREIRESKGICANQNTQ